MNILIINSSKTAFGGLENQTLHLARALIERGHAVLLGCAAGSPVCSNALKSGVPVEKIAFANAGDPVAVFKLLGAIRRHRAEFVVATMGKEYWPVAIAAKITGRKSILIRHMADPLKKRTLWLARTAVDKVIAVSGFVKEGLVESGLPDRKVSVVHNGIEAGRFAPRPGLRPQVRAEFYFEDEDFVIGAAGALNAGKGLFVLMEAVSLFQKSYFRKVKVLLAGEGEGRNELEKRAEELGVSAVFAGRRLDMEHVYHAMDLFVFPTICRESFGMVVIEAMAAGLPVIASSVGGVPEVVRDGENGILVPPGDPVALAGAMRLVASPAGEVSRIIKTGAARSVEDRFSARAMAAGFEAALNGIMPRLG